MENEKRNIVTRGNISIYPLTENKDEKIEIYKTLDNWRYYSWLLANDIYSRLYAFEMQLKRTVFNSNEYISTVNIDNDYKIKLNQVKENSQDLLEKKIETVKKNLKKTYDKCVRDAKKSNIELFNATRKRMFNLAMRYNSGNAGSNYQSYTYGITKEEQYNSLPSSVRNDVSNAVLAHFKADQKNGLFKGSRSIRNYRRENMNIYFSIGALRKNKDKTPKYGQGVKTGIIKDNEGYILYTPKGLKFRLHLGRDRSNNKDVIERILTGEYKLCDSYVKRGKKGYNFFMSVSMPQKKQHLDGNICVGVDIGIKNPAVCGLNKGMQREYIGSEFEVRDYQLQIRRRRMKLQSSCEFAKGGKGRKKKLKAMNRLDTYQSDWTKTYNHNISRRVINFAKTHNAGVIKMEFLEGYGAEHKSNIVCGNWPYYQLQQMVEYKAKMEGIKVVYIDPYHTSKICSFCGRLHTGLKLKDRVIKCPNCEKEYDRDYNAARNIAVSDKIVGSREECEYHKITKKKSA